MRRQYEMMIPMFAVAFILILLVILVCYRKPSASGRKVITAYTMPWCPACKRLAPEWAKLQQMGHPEIDAVNVDCSTDDCSAIDRYPTIICQGKQYSGDRTAEAMKAWAIQA